MRSNGGNCARILIKGGYGVLTSGDQLTGDVVPHAAQSDYSQLHFRFLRDS